MTYRDVLIKHYKIAERKKQQVEKLAALRDGTEKDANMGILMGLAPLLFGGAAFANSKIPTQRNDIMLKALGGSDFLKNMVAGGGGDAALNAAGSRLLNSSGVANMLPWNWGKARAKRQLQTIQKQPGGGVESVTKYLRGLVAPEARGMAQSMGLSDGANLSQSVSNLIDAPARQVKTLPPISEVSELMRVMGPLLGNSTSTGTGFNKKTITSMPPEYQALFKNYLDQMLAARFR